MAEREQTRAELAAELERLKAENEALKTPAPPPVPAALSLPKRVRYQGTVKAKEACYIGHLRAKGEVFEVDVPALWADDPYVPVVVTGYHESGTAIAKRNPQAPTPIDPVLRSAIMEAEAKAAPQATRVTDAADLEDLAVA